MRKRTHKRILCPKCNGCGGFYRRVNSTHHTRFMACEECHGLMYVLRRLDDGKRNVTQEFLDTPIATLYDYGLEVRVINKLENNLGAIYVRDLTGMDTASIEAIEGVGSEGRSRLTRTLAELLEHTRTPKHLRSDVEVRTSLGLFGDDDDEE